ncbi:hypothetical protein FRC17_000583 [Serendipita sp. 399]|nr:hypothetical protein FRC17_000583 [Serendipita sp. 399]
MSKAILQPNNHICVIEYTKERQRHDLQLIQANPRNAQYDELLLALVGILEEMRSQTDVAQWLSQGGLRRVAVDPVQNEVDVVERFAGMSIGSDSSPWFDDKEVLRFWITRGRQTLERLQIPIRAMTW